MGDEYKALIVRQGAQVATQFVAARVRSRSASKLEAPPEPERPALAAAEQLLANPEAEPGQAIGPDGTVVELPYSVPDGLFDGILLRENEKVVLLNALRSPKPVHVLMRGDAASGKSQLLQEIATLPRSRYAVGGATTSAGLLDYLLEQPNTRNLVIDELDKADPRDLYALYSLMESGIVTRLQHDDQVQRIHKVWVFAAANDLTRIPPALLSRFVRLELKPYSAAELLAVNRHVLEQDGLSPARAQAIAAAAAARSHDPRAARDLGRLVGEDGEIGPMLERVIPRARRPG